VSGRRYLTGLTLLGFVAAVALALVAPPMRTTIVWGIAIGSLVQAPLGWITVRSVGTERLQVIWALGMLIRVTIVGVTGLLLVPALHWDMVPLLGSLVLTILLLLGLEVLTVMRENSGINAR
jgi:hypothetical protein